VGGGGLVSLRHTALLLGALALPACGLFASKGPSSVAQGKYFSTANPQYDEFFVAIYDLQQGLSVAPEVPESERQRLARALSLPPQTALGTVAARLREEPQKVGHDQLLASAANLRRSMSDMQADSDALARLEVNAISLDANVDVAFAGMRAGTRSDVKKNLADAQKLIVLMKARVSQVRTDSDLLLHATGTETPTPIAVPDPEHAPGAEAKKPVVDAKKPQKPASKPVSSSAPTPAPKPAPPVAKPHATESEEGAPEKPKAPSKPAPPPRDFEP